MIIPYIYVKYIFYVSAFVGVPVLLLIFLKIFQRFTLGKCKSLVCLSGKTAIVTGGASGIGYETALQLAARGCRVIIADKYSSLRAVKNIIRITRNPNVLNKYLDLGSLKSVRDFARDIIESEDRLDILINNASATSVGNNYTDDGLHETMQTNHFGPFLLTNLLVDLLKKSAPSRIIFVSSAASFFSNLSIENLNYPKDHPLSLFRSALIHGNSKLCNVIVANGFAKRLEDYGITCNSLHPGWVNTKRWENAGESVGLEGIDQIILSPISYVYAKTPREGAQTTLHLAMSESVKNVTGKHFWDCVTFPLPPGARNEKFCQDIWAESEIFVKLTESEKLPPLNPKVKEETAEEQSIKSEEENNSVPIENKEQVAEMKDTKLEIIFVENAVDTPNIKSTNKNFVDSQNITILDGNNEEIVKTNGEDQEILDGNHEEIVKTKEEDQFSESILRFRKINDRNDFVNLNGTNKEHHEEKERS